MKEDYKQFVDRMIDKYEGGYGWDKSDPGGPTKYGITCYDLAEHRGEKMDSMTRWAPIVKAMTRDEAEEIYITKYAAKIDFDELPAGVDCCMMDYAVNSGYARAVRVACALVGHPAREVMNDVLLQKIKARDPEKFIQDMCEERIHFMHGIRGGAAWAQFGSGWERRVNDLDDYCHKITHNARPENHDNQIQPAPGPDLQNTPTPKATHTAPDAGEVAKQVGKGTVVVTAPAAAGVPWYAVAIAVGVVVAVGVVFYFVRQHRASVQNATVVLPQ